MPNPYLKDVNLPVALLERQLDQSFRVTWANDAWWIVTELQPENCLDRQLSNWLDRTACDQVDMQLNHIDQIKGSVRFIIPLDLPQGPSLFDAFLHPVEGQTSQVMMTLQDVTQEQHLRETLVLQSKYHKETVQQMEQFISFAAHDLRSPMRNVQLIAGMLKEDFHDHGDGKLEMIDMISDIGSTASDVIEDLLNYSRSSTLIEKTSELNFDNIRQDVESVLNPQGRHSILFLPAILETDQVVLRIILQNLIDNSIKFACQDQVSVSVDVCEAEAGLLEFVVTDSGPGFENPTKAFLKTKEFRCDSGFGLFGINRLIANRGGNICALSPKSGHGAQILFQIPGKMKIQKQKSA